MLSSFFIRSVGSFSHMVFEEMTPATVLGPTPITRAVQTPLTTKDLARSVPIEPS